MTILDKVDLGVVASRPGFPAGLKVRKKREKGSKGRFFRAAPCLNSDPLNKKTKNKKQVLVVSSDDVAQLRASLESYDYCGMSFRGRRAWTGKGLEWGARGWKCQKSARSIFASSRISFSLRLFFPFLLIFFAPPPPPPHKQSTPLYFSHYGFFVRGRLAGARGRKHL